MSRSKRHTPIQGNVICDSEKSCKKMWHQRMRAALRHYLHSVNPDEKPDPHVREVSNVWAFGKDGKHWFDKKEQPKSMRK